MIHPFSSFFYSLFYTCKSIFKIAVFIPFRNRYKYRPCNEKIAFILANGPSLAVDIGRYIEILRKRDIFVMNQFVASDFFQRVKPKYYVLADPVYWINDISETEKGFVVELIDGLNNLVDWDMTLFFPNKALSCENIKKIKENRHIKVTGYSTLALNGFRFCRNYWYQKNIGMSSPQTVLNASVFLALNSGYKIINVLGADHTFIQQLSVGYDNLIYVEDKHFYDREKVKKVAMVDGHAKDWTMEKWLVSIVKMFESHRILKEYAKCLEAKIYNLTSETTLDVYERRRIEDSL